MIYVYCAYYAPKCYANGTKSFICANRWRELFLVQYTFQTWWKVLEWRWIRSDEHSQLTRTPLVIQDISSSSVRSSRRAHVTNERTLCAHKRALLPNLTDPLAIVKLLPGDKSQISSSWSLPSMYNAYLQADRHFFAPSSSWRTQRAINSMALNGMCIAPDAI